MTNPLIDSNGTLIWCNDKGKLHRLDGPAYIDADGGQEWWFNDNRHRLDGPAYIDADHGRNFIMNYHPHRHLKKVNKNQKG